MTACAADHLARADGSIPARVAIADLVVSVDAGLGFPVPDERVHARWTVEVVGAGTRATLQGARLMFGDTLSQELIVDHPDVNLVSGVGQQVQAMLSGSPPLDGHLVEGVCSAHRVTLLLSFLVDGELVSGTASFSYVCAR